MASFTIDMSGAFRSGWKKELGGPGVGTHSSGDWFIRSGMDFGVAEGTEVLATFSGHVTKFEPHVPSKDSSKEYGAKIFMRSENNKMGGYFTHITDTPILSIGDPIDRGARLGKTMRDHLHHALVEIIGGAPGGRYVGVNNLYPHFVSLRDTEGTAGVTFKQDGSAPVVGSAPAPPPGPSFGWLNGWWKVWDGNTYYYFFAPGGVVQYVTAPPHAMSAPPARPENQGRYSYAPNELIVTWDPIPGLAACQETFYNAVPGCRNMNATSNLYSPLVGTRLS